MKSKAGSRFRSAENDASELPRPERKKRKLERPPMALLRADDECDPLWISDEEHGGKVVFPPKSQQESARPRSNGGKVVFCEEDSSPPVITVSTRSSQLLALQHRRQQEVAESRGNSCPPGVSPRHQERVADDVAKSASSQSCHNSSHLTQNPVWLVAASQGAASQLSLASTVQLPAVRELWPPRPRLTAASGETVGDLLNRGDSPELGSAASSSPPSPSPSRCSGDDSRDPPSDVSWRAAEASAASQSEEKSDPRGAAAAAPVAKTEFSDGFSLPAAADELPLPHRHHHHHHGAVVSHDTRVEEEERRKRKQQQRADWERRCREGTLSDLTLEDLVVRHERALGSAEEEKQALAAVRAGAAGVVTRHQFAARAALTMPTLFEVHYRIPNKVIAAVGTISQFCTRAGPQLPPMASDSCETFSVFVAVMIASLRFAGNMRLFWNRVALNYFVYLSAWLHQLSSPMWSAAGKVRPTVADVDKCLGLSTIFPVKLGSFIPVFYHERARVRQLLEKICEETRHGFVSSETTGGGVCGYVVVSGDYAFSVVALFHGEAPAKPDSADGSEKNKECEAPWDNTAGASVDLHCWRFYLLDSHGTLPWSGNCASLSSVMVIETIEGRALVCVDLDIFNEILCCVLEHCRRFHPTVSKEPQTNSPDVFSSAPALCVDELDGDGDLVMMVPKHSHAKKGHHSHTSSRKTPEHTTWVPIVWRQGADWVSPDALQHLINGVFVPWAANSAVSAVREASRRFPSLKVFPTKEIETLLRPADRRPSLADKEESAEVVTPTVIHSPGQHKTSLAACAETQSSQNRWKNTPGLPAANKVPLPRPSTKAPVLPTTRPCAKSPKCGRVEKIQRTLRLPVPASQPWTSKFTSHSPRVESAPVAPTVPFSLHSHPPSPSRERGRNTNEGPTEGSPTATAETKKQARHSNNGEEERRATQLAGTKERPAAIYTDDSDATSPPEAERQPKPKRTPAAADALPPNLVPRKSVVEVTPLKRPPGEKGHGQPSNFRSAPAAAVCGSLIPGQLGPVVPTPHNQPKRSTAGAPVQTEGVGAWGKL